MVLGCFLENEVLFLGISRENEYWPHPTVLVEDRQRGTRHAGSTVVEQQGRCKPATDLDAYNRWIIHTLKTCLSAAEKVSVFL